MEKLGINLGFLLVQIFNFAIIFIVLREWAYKPLLNMLEKRRNTIAHGLEDARVAAEARANAEKEAARILAEAQAQADKVVQEAAGRAEAAARDIRATADAEAAKARESALAEVEQDRARILGELRGEVVSLAMAAAHKLIGESLTQERQRALLQEFFSGVKGGKVAVLEGAETPAGGAAEVTSALPLTGDEQDAVKRDVLTRLGGSASISFRVDPSILGGLVVRVGDRVVDGSVAGQLQTLRQNLH